MIKNMQLRAYIWHGNERQWIREGGDYGTDYDALQVIFDSLEEAISAAEKTRRRYFSDSARVCIINVGEPFCAEWPSLDGKYRIVYSDDPKHPSSSPYGHAPIPGVSKPSDHGPTK